MSEGGQTPAPSPRAVVITGGSSGIGLCTALLFAQRGWRVGLIARGEAGLAAARDRIAAAGGSAAYAVADVADADALEAAAAALEADLGPAEVWINNAGASFFAPFLDITEAEFRRVVDVTFFGTVNGTRTALKRMRPRQRGTIVNIGSLAAYRAAPLQSPYSAAKFAVRGFTEALRGELAHERNPVHLATVHPPSVNTPFFSHAGARMPGEPRPLPPVFQPEIIAEAIWLAVAERRREVKVTGATVQIAFLNRLAPRLTDWFVGRIGFAAQQTSAEEVTAQRDAALFEAAKRPSQVHGPFGREAYASSAQMWAEHNRLALGLGAALLAIAALPRRRRR